ncbi:DinB family protein [Mucilaginibacter ginsenosidivorans]|uniref:DinB family protein n=1 Tax=Mucilaginibacter ginsenosidivorans TaxID=398053 RepID=A0A5B8V1J7_9SPHI|nr:DinB family protein [Mucilaginibacter ginsenosidivorans]QEC64925.1 DinB family protein [Mucilaginibacter ginsenosidivorans]
MKNELAAEILSTKEILLKALGSFTGLNINQVPFEGSWTGGQVGEHVLKSASGILQTITGPVKPADRDPEQNVQPLADSFLNFEIKFQSPDFIIPSDEPKDRDYLLTALNDAFEGIRQVTESADLNLVCTGFEMPVIGQMTRLEFINFTVFHTKRHTHQLNNILKYL